jgi:hypothetical protein
MKLLKPFTYGFCLTLFALQGMNFKKSKNITKVEEKPDSQDFFYVESTSSVPGFENSPCHFDCVFKYAIYTRDHVALENCYTDCKLRKEEYNFENTKSNSKLNDHEDCSV